MDYLYSCSIFFKRNKRIFKQRYVISINRSFYRIFYYYKKLKDVFLLNKEKGSILPRGIRIYGGKGISTPFTYEGHATFIEIGTPQNIRVDKEGYKVFENFLKNSRENGGEW